MALTLKPLGDRVVVEPIEQEEVTPGGIVYPKPPKRNPSRGSSRLSAPVRAMKREIASHWM